MVSIVEGAAMWQGYLCETASFAAHRLPYPDVVPNTLRQRIDHASLPLMTRLSRLPRLVPSVTLLALLVAGVLIGGPVGFVLMALAAVFVAWILYLSWPGLSSSERIMRFAVLLLAVAMAVVQLFPRG